MENRFLKIISFKDFYIWDAKRYYAEGFNSNVPRDLLGNHIKEESHKVKLSNFPDQTFKILGISNSKGMFDAYTEIGKNINQPYKKVENGYIAYNPYRINVGSIGFKTEKLQNDYISPAYVVFSCKDDLLPEYLFLLMRSSSFNKVIRENTSGSVRQNLSYKTLSQLEIPIPGVEEQRKLIADYYQSLAESKKILDQAKEARINLNNYFRKELFIINKPKDKEKMFATVKCSSLSKRWDSWNQDIPFESTKYPFTDFGDCTIGEPQYGAGEKGLDEFTGIRYIRITDIHDDGSLNDDKISAAKSDSKYRLNDKDFLIARSGSVGKTFLYKESDGPSIYAGYLIKYKLNEEIVLPEYILLYTKTDLFKVWVETAQRISVQPNINAQEYLLSPIIVPPLEKQKEMVAIGIKFLNEAIDFRNKHKKAVININEEFCNKIFA